MLSQCKTALSERALMVHAGVTGAFLVGTMFFVGCSQSPSTGQTESQRSSAQPANASAPPADDTSGSKSQKEIVVEAAVDGKAGDATGQANIVSPKITQQIQFDPAIPPADGPALRAEAEIFFNDLVRLVPNNADALEVKARYHLMVGESEAARECWESALKLVPDYAYAWHGLGKIAMLHAETEEAIRLFAKALVPLKDNPDLVHDASDAYLKAGRIEEAIDLLKQATGRAPGSTATWLLLGQAHLAHLDFENARMAFEQTLVLSPGLPRAQQGLGTALLRLGRRDEAQKLLVAQRAVRTAGKNLSEQEAFEEERTDVAKRFAFAARVYLASGDLIRGEAALRRATRIQPAVEDAWAVLISFYTQQNQLAKAITAADEMCRIAPDNPSYHYTLGVLFRKQGNHSKAASEFESVMRLAPKSSQGYEAMTRLMIETRTNLDRCVGWAQKSVELRGSAADHELLAQSYAVTGNLEAAKKSLEKAIELDVKNTAYQQAMQQLLRAMGGKNE